MKCNREVTPQYLGISQRQGGCKYCSVPGLNWQDESTVYLLAGTHFMKVGIANTKTLATRLRKHQKWGLEVLSLWVFESGDAAYKIEQSVVQWWRKERNAEAIPEAFLPDGWTETVSLVDVSIQDTIMKIELLIREGA
jgi:hypothetical protein